VFALNTLNGEMTRALTEVLGRVQRSLVVVHNGRYGAGAGVIWRSEGLIVTNNHVVQRGRIRITLHDGREFPAQIAYADPEIDLALLRIEAHDLPPATPVDSRGLRVGELVFAVGHPWGQRGFVTAGIVSSLGTAVTRGRRKSIPIVRSDVDLAPGNSGGPLINAVGGVVGINTMIVGGDQGVAIPSHLVDAFVDEYAGSSPQQGAGPHSGQQQTEYI
jgi:serine protease Do